MASFSTKIASPAENLTYYLHELQHHVGPTLKFFFQSARETNDKNLRDQAKKNKESEPTGDALAEKWRIYLKLVEKWGDDSKKMNYRLFISQLNEIYSNFDIQEILRRAITSKSAIICASSYFIADPIIRINDDELKQFIYKLLKKCAYVLRRSNLFDAEFSFLDEEKIEEMAFVDSITKTLSDCFNKYIENNSERIAEIRSETDQYSRDPKAELERQKMLESFFKSMKREHATDTNENEQHHRPKYISFQKEPERAEHVDDDDASSYAENSTVTGSVAATDVESDNFSQGSSHASSYASIARPIQPPVTAIDRPKIDPIFEKNENNDTASVASSVATSARSVKFNDQIESVPFDNKDGIKLNEKTTSSIHSHEDTSDNSTQNNSDTGGELVDEKIAKLRKLLQGFKTANAEEAV